MNLRDRDDQLLRSRVLVGITGLQSVLALIGLADGFIPFRREQPASVVAIRFAILSSFAVLSCLAFWWSRQQDISPWKYGAVEILVLISATYFAINAVSNGDVVSQPTLLWVTVFVALGFRATAWKPRRSPVLSRNDGPP